MRKKVIPMLLSVIICVALILPASANNTKLVAITFDDGPNKTYTPILLDGLNKRNVNATFFLVGQWVEYMPELVSRMAAEGNQIGNHSYDHPWFSKLSSDGIVSEVKTTDDILKGVTGQSGFLLRVPYGDCYRMDRSVTGKPVIQWSIDPCSGVMSRSQQYMLNNIYNNIFDGAIILLHDANQKNVDVGLTAIDSLLDWGYEFVTVSELYRLRNIQMQNSVIYFSAKPGAQEQQFDERFITSHWAWNYIQYVQNKHIMEGNGLGFQPNGYLTRAMAAETLWRAAGSPAAKADSGFADVSAKDWYAKAVSWAKSQKYISGDGSGMYDPNGYMTKEQFYTLIARFAADKLSNAPEKTSVAYRDDARLHKWAFSSVQAIRKTGFSSKNDPEIFRPLDFISRAEAAELLTYVLRDI